MYSVFLLGFYHSAVGVSNNLFVVNVRRYREVSGEDISSILLIARYSASTGKGGGFSCWIADAAGTGKAT